MKKYYLLLVFLFSFLMGFAQSDSLSLEEQQRREKNIQAGNPFKKFGYKPKISTLSQGKYLEFHDLDSVVQIGSFTYHVKKKVITGFILNEKRYSEATLRPEIISRWMSPDPLSEEFPSWSPYNFTYNNPIRFVDPDGRAAFDHIEVMKNKDGTHTVVDGELNDDKNIYVVDEDGNRTGEVLGQLKNEYDFFEYTADGFGEPLVGATIGKKLPDESNYGAEYLQRLKTKTLQRLSSDVGTLNQLNTLAVLSVNDGPLDIKVALGARDGYEYSPGVYTTGREMGNILFGANLRAIYDVMNISPGSNYRASDFYKFTMKAFIGRYNQLQNGRGYNGFPAYGEDLGSSLGIYKGYFKGL